MAQATKKVKMTQEELVEAVNLRMQQTYHRKDIVQLITDAEIVPPLTDKAGFTQRLITAIRCLMQYLHDTELKSIFIHKEMIDTFVELVNVCYKNKQRTSLSDLYDADFTLQKIYPLLQDDDKIECTGCVGLRCSKILGDDIVQFLRSNDAMHTKLIMFIGLHDNYAAIRMFHRSMQDICIRRLYSNLTQMWAILVEISRKHKFCGVTE